MEFKTVLWKEKVLTHLHSGGSAVANIRWRALTSSLRSPRHLTTSVPFHFSKFSLVEIYVLDAIAPELAGEQLRQDFNHFINHAYRFSIWPGLFKVLLVWIITIVCFLCTLPVKIILTSFVIQYFSLEVNTRVWLPSKPAPELSNGPKLPVWAVWAVVL